MNREKFEKLMGLVYEVNEETGNIIEFVYVNRNNVKFKVYDLENGKIENISLGVDYTLIEEDYDYLINICEKMLEESEVPV